MKARASLALLALLSLGAVACGEDAVTQSTYEAPPAAPPAPSASAAAEPAVELQEADFLESDRSRDPFRNFAKAFVDEARSEVKTQREVVLEQYAIDELTLIAIVTGDGMGYAMLVDPTGVGYVVQRGQYVGRASVVQPAGGVGAAYEVNWRVDRIRDGDVVLVRDDPSNPEVPSSTRVLPLRIEDVSMSESETGGDLQSELAALREKLQSMESQAGSRSGTAPTSGSASSGRTTSPAARPQ